MKLQDTEMSASLNSAVWSAKKYDKKVSKEVADKHGMSDSSLGRYNKSLVAKKSLEKINKIATAARADFHKFSLPWDDNGTRILTSAGFFKLAEAMRKHNNDFLPAKDEVIENYPEMVEQAKTDSKGLFNPDDYPAKAEISNKFRYAWRVRPLPDAGDFRVKLSDTETALIQQQITADVQESVKHAMQDIWARMQDVIQAAANKLKAYKVTADGVENPFRDSLIQNIKDLLEIIPALNLTEDPKVAQFASYMKQLVKYDANTLRDNDGTRMQIAKAADDILTKMQAYV